jgi:hypothetical protein
MPTDHNEIERLAEKIADLSSEIVREAFRNARPEDPYCSDCSMIYYTDPRLMDAYPAHHDPDCPADDDGGTRWSFTPLGQQVRAIIERESHD